MRIEFTEEGGVAHFPGLAAPVMVDTDHMPEDEAAELKQCIGACNFFDLPATVGAPRKGAADYRQYTFTIDDGEHKKTVRVLEPVEDSSLQELIRTMRRQAKALRAARPR